jgi:archaellum component FlaC
MLNNSEAVLDFYKSMLEKRIDKLERSYENIREDLEEIKSNVKWVMKLVFTLNTTIIGILTKGFGIF